jgi:hypothetical protein
MSDPGRRGRVFGIQKGNRRFFSREDDETLRQFKAVVPELSWPQIVECMPGFTARQLRERWCNYLSPNLNTTTWTSDDDRRMFELYADLGPQWGIIGAHMGNRAAPDIKNRFQNLANKQKREISTRAKHRKRGGKKIATVAMVPHIAIDDREAPPSGMEPSSDPRDENDHDPGSRDDHSRISRDPPDLSIRNLLVS